MGQERRESKMKKFVVAVFLAVCLMFTGIVQAEVQPFQWLGTDVSVEVDVHYFLNRSLKGKLGGGVAVEFAQLFNNIVGLRGELAIPIDKPDEAPDKLAGLGGALKIHNTINEIGGKSIIPERIQMGLSATMDFTRGIEWEEIRNPYLSLLTVGIQF